MREGSHRPDFLCEKVSLAFPCKIDHRGREGSRETSLFIVVDFRGRERERGRAKKRERKTETLICCCPLIHAFIE